MLKDLDIKIYESYQMQEWNNCKWSSGQLVRNVYFQKIKGQEDDNVRSLSLDCCVSLVTNQDSAIFK